MTSSNGNIFHVTGPLWGEFTGPGEFPTQRPVTRSFDVFFDLRLNKRLSKHSWGWWFETLSWSLWRHHNDTNGCRDLPHSWRVMQTEFLLHHVFNAFYLEKYPKIFIFIFFITHWQYGLNQQLWFVARFWYLVQPIHQILRKPSWMI